MSSSNTISLSSSITSLPFIPTPLLDTDITSLTPVKLIPSSSSPTPFTSISHNPQGSYFITTSPDGTLQLFDSLRLKQYKTIYSKKYGCSNALFTLKSATQSIPNSCIISSTLPTTDSPVLNNSLRYLDLNTNSFIRYFQGHEAQISSLVSMVNPIFGLDSFYSSSIDGTIRAWDTRSEKSYSCLSNQGANPIIAIDQSGTLLASWNSHSNSISIIPIEKFPVGLIGVVNLDNSIIANFYNKRLEKMSWSNNLLLLDFPGCDKIVIDTISLKTVGILTGVVNFLVDNQSDDVSRNGSMDISPDGKWCLAGSGDGTILAWDLSNFSNLKSVDDNILHVSPIKIVNEELIDKQIVPRILCSNPKLGTVVTADTEIVISMYNSNNKK